MTDNPSSATEGIHSGSYDDWPITALQERAQQLGIPNTETLRKEDLINLIRNRI